MNALQASVAPFGPNGENTYETQRSMNRVIRQGSSKWGRAALVFLVAMPACSELPKHVGEARAFCEGEAEIFETELFADSRVEFDLTRPHTLETATEDDARGFEQTYPISPLRIATLIAVQRYGGRAFGSGVDVIVGAPAYLTNPFDGVRGANDIVFYRGENSSDCSISRSVLGFVDDYLHYAETGEHVDDWESGPPLAIGYYGIHVWGGNVARLREVRLAIYDIIESGQCLEYSLLSNTDDRPVATSVGVEHERGGSMVSLAEHSIRFDGYPLFLYRNAVVYPRGRSGEVQFYCCNSSLPWACSAPTGWSANARAMALEFEERHD